MLYFVAGTDTDCGKTLIASALLYQAKQTGTTLGVKPVASGCELTPDGLRNSDALSLMAQSTLKLAYSQVNPFAFAPAIAPHIAALQCGQNLTATAIIDHLATLPFTDVDFAIVEGAGGWRLPLNQEEFLSQVVQRLSLPVILVVGVKLGCLNHALLTQEAMLADGVQIAGWVANMVDPAMSVAQQNLDSLHHLMSSPCLGVVPYFSALDEQAKVSEAARHLSLDMLNQ